MRLTSTLAIVALAVMPVVATAQAPAPAAPAAAKPAYSTASTIGQLMDNAAAKEIVLKYAPDLAQAAGNPQAAGITVKDIQGYIPSLTDKILADMDAELAKVPAPK